VATTTIPVSSVKKPSEEPKQPSDFLFGKCLGEGAYARVVHAKLKKNNNQFAIKIMEKMHIKKENKVIYKIYTYAL
jgi:3-phosphoinositide dependent protein kinase-1